MDHPGLIDLQVNGFLGIDFSGPDLTEPNAQNALREILRAGTAAFLATLITGPEDMYRRNLPLLARLTRSPEFRGRLLGLHIEGPFISPQDGPRGAHPAQFTRPADLDFLKKILDWSEDTVRLLTLAADLPGSERLTRYAVDHGVAVSLGHHLADEDDLRRHVDAGATALTHLGNGLPNQLPRHHNPLWAGLAEDRLTAMIITDGHHLPPALIKTILRAKGPDRTIVVSDASAPAGLPSGRYHTMGAKAVLEPNGRLHNPATGFLVGSSAAIRDCLNHLVSLDLLPPADLPRLFYHNPLRLLTLDPGQIAPAALTP